MSKEYKYSDITLIPAFSSCISRSECDTSINLFGKKYKLPIMPSNMKSVVNMQIAKRMSNSDYFYIMHRFDNSIIDDITQANVEEWKNISFSVGVKDQDKITIENIRNNNLRVDYLTIDIAHGHSEKMLEMIKFIKDNLSDAKIIAGNVATKQAVIDLATAGADIVKVGIGQGSPCTTKDKTGFTLPMFSCVKNCSNVYIGEDDEDMHKVPIIADGGISCNGDIAKALVAGATMVMAGGIFAACADSPATVVQINGEYHKAYFGSASYENKKHRNHIEGKLNKIPNNSMSYFQKLFEIQQDLQSAVSYAGGTNLSCFPSVKYTLI
jgi:GMP reductase